MACGNFNCALIFFVGFFRIAFTLKNRSMVPRITTWLILQRFARIKNFNFIIFTKTKADLRSGLA